MHVSREATALFVPKMVVDGLDTCVNILQISNASSSSPPRTPSIPCAYRPKTFRKTATDSPLLYLLREKKHNFPVLIPRLTDFGFQHLAVSTHVDNVRWIISPPPPELHSSLGSASTSRNLPIRHPLHLGSLCRLVTTPQASTKRHPPPAHSNLRLFSPKFAQNREVHSRRFRIDLFESSCYSSSNSTFDLFLSPSWSQSIQSCRTSRGAATLSSASTLLSCFSFFFFP